MDAITLLKNDHRKVEKIFSDIEKGNGNRKQLFTELATELTVHAEIEEQLFYPAAKDAEPTRDLVLESYEEHKQVKMVLSDLEQADMNTDTWLAGLKVLMEDVQHHVGERGIRPNAHRLSAAVVARRGREQSRRGAGRNVCGSAWICPGQ